MAPRSLSHDRYSFANLEEQLKMVVLVLLVRVAVLLFNGLQD